jgi:tetratricopeptide (TPR) repeat protein
MAVDEPADNLDRARTLLAQHAFTEAEAVARREIQLDPYSARAYVLLASALIGQGKAPPAVAAAERAVALGPDLAEAHVALASALLADGRPEHAESAARRAVALDTASADAHMVLGNALSERGATTEAERELDLAIALEPVDAEAERNWKRSRAPVVIAVTVAGVLAFEAVRLLVDRFTDWRVAIALLVVTLVFVVAILLGLTVQRRRMAKLSPGEKLELALESRRRRARGEGHYYAHLLFLAVVIGGLSIVTILFAIGQKATVQVAVGDCFSLDRMVSIEQISTIPCEIPHDVEVFAVLTEPAPPGAEYPGIDTLHQRLRTECERLYESYVGVPFSRQAPTAINTFAPEESYWRLDIRTQFCALRDWRERQLVGSYRC